MVVKLVISWMIWRQLSLYSDELERVLACIWFQQCTIKKKILPDHNLLVKRSRLFHSCNYWTAMAVNITPNEHLSRVRIVGRYSLHSLLRFWNSEFSACSLSYMVSASYIGALGRLKWSNRNCLGSCSNVKNCVRKMSTHIQQHFACSHNVRRLAPWHDYEKSHEPETFHCVIRQIWDPRAGGGWLKRWF